MKVDIKSGVEYVVIMLLVVGLCLWQIIVSIQDGELFVVKLVVFGLGFVVVGFMYCVFMMQFVCCIGWVFWFWFVVIVVFMFVGIVVLFVLLFSEVDVV